jgi:magnesium transporter
MPGTKSRRQKARVHRRVPPGAPPGTLIADPNAAKPVMRVMAYSGEQAVEATLQDVAEISAYLSKWPVTWLNIDGLGDAGVIARIGELFNLHRLSLEDVLNTHQRSKVEAYGDHLYMVFRETERGCGAATDQISLYLGKNFVITFQERHGDCMGGVRERIRTAERFRTQGPDYLAYAILDAVIDCYFPTLEDMGERLESLEEEVVLSPTEDMVHRIHSMKREMLQIRRAVWPMRDSVNILLRDPNPLIKDETRLYIRDCHDHVIQLIDMLETYRELGSDLMDIYLSSQSNRLNSVMKVLTMIATIFMPLSFIAGVYGMNFDFMPELHWKYGYLLVWIFMAVVFAGMMYYFKRKGWLGSLKPKKNHAEKKSEPQ